MQAIKTCAKAALTFALKFLYFNINAFKPQAVRL